MRRKPNYFENYCANDSGSSDEENARPIGSGRKNVLAPGLTRTQKIESLFTAKVCLT